MRTILVTGAAGFLGFHLSEKFLALGYNLIAVDNFSTGSRAHKDLLENNKVFGGKVLFVEADICNPWSSWASNIPEAWLRNLDFVFHFASPASPAHYLRLSIETLNANSVGLNHALHFADSVKARVIFSSTSEVYGSSKEKPQHEDQWGQVNSFGERSCYHEAKRFGEALIFSHNKRFNTHHGLVRIFNTYGPRMNPTDGRVVINFLMQASRGEPLTIYGDGTQTRSFCYVDDLIEAVSRYAFKKIAEPVNIGNPEELNVIKLAELVSSFFPKKRLEVLHKPLPQEDPLQRCPDITKAQQLLDGWAPQISLHEGLLKMKAWYEQ